MLMLRQYSGPLLLALVLHVTAAMALLQGWNPDKEVLNFVQPKMVNANLIVIEPKARPRVDPAAAQKAQAARDKAARERAARDKAAEQAARDKAAAAKAAQDKAARDKAAREKVAQDKAAAEQAAREAQQERMARLSELAASSLEQAIAEESADLQAGTEEMVVRSYHAAIYDLVRGNWSRPPSARTGMRTRLQVELIPTGEVVAVTVIEPSGNAAFDRSAEQAVRQSKRFEVPTENALFEKHFRRFYILFQPEDLLR